MLALKPSIERYNNLERREQVVLSRLRTRCSLLTHGHNINRENPAQCDECQEQISTNHFLWECPKYNELRRKVQITKHCFHKKEERAERIIKYIKETEFFDQL
jgi:hypothetical protein